MLQEILFAAFWFFSMLVTYGVASERGRNKAIAAGIAKPPAQPQGPPVCGCQDHLSNHDPVTGRCHVMRQGVVEWTKEGRAKRYGNVQCSCRQYVGPIPAGAMILPPMLPTVVVTSEVDRG